MGTLTAQNKEIVIPGQTVAQGLDYLPGHGSYRDQDDIVASRIGMVNVDGRTIRIIPLAGRYSPQRDDVIICKVTDLTFNGWLLDTNCPYHAMLPIKEATSEFLQRGADLTKFYDIGDYIVCKILTVTSQKLVDVTMRGPGNKMLEGGRIIEANTHKVPRIIGKQGSMVQLIKDATNCRIIVGQNGIIWIEGEPKNEYVATQAIKKIEQESHHTGLTETIKSFLEEQMKKVQEIHDADPKKDADHKKKGGSKK